MIIYLLIPIMPALMCMGILCRSEYVCTVFIFNHCWTSCDGLTKSVLIYDPITGSNNCYVAEDNFLLIIFLNGQ